MMQPVAASSTTRVPSQTSLPEEGCQRLEAYFGESIEVEADLTYADFQAFSKSASNTDFQAAQMLLTASLLMKLRQTEKAAHFAERRQDADASLPSELDRHIQGYKQEMAQATLAGQTVKIQAIKKQWSTDKRDAIWRGFQTGCLCGIYRAVWLTCCTRF